jgi:DNA-binding MarR family transcriptional regulator
MPRKYRVILTPEQREELTRLISSGRSSALTLCRARVLLKADEAEGSPAWTNAAIAEALEVDDLTITRIRKRFVERGLEGALYRKEQERRKAPALDGAQQAHLIALACGPAPAGRSHWALRLLADRMVELGHVEQVSHETARQVLKRGTSSRT